MSKKFGITLIVLLYASLAACASFYPSHRDEVSSSLMSFLYPGGAVPDQERDETPNLKVPVTVGLAFVPTMSSGYTSGLPEALKNELLERVKASFKSRAYIREIRVIPEIYLRSGKGGFETLDQVSRLYGVDVIALVSYDQVSGTAETNWSLLYWTILGAYVIKGNENDVSTFVDTAIFDARTRKLLFRAPGTDTLTRSSTLVEAPRVAQKTREESFSRAMDQMAKNLDGELQTFRERIKTDKSVTITSSADYRAGGGAFSPKDLAVLLIAAVLLTGFRRTGALAQRKHEAR